MFISYKATKFSYIIPYKMRKMYENTVRTLPQRSLLEYRKMTVYGIYKEKARCLSELLAVWTGLIPSLS
jgi:hypothetical protein